MKFAFYIFASLAIASCSPRPDATPKLITAYDQLQRDDFWTLVHVAYFADGGSVALSFIGHDGNIIHLWADAARPSRFFLKRTYDDTAAVEVSAGSQREQRVLTLLASCRFLHQQNNILEPLPKLCAAMLRDRALLPPDGWPGVPTRELPTPDADAISK